MLAEKQDAPAGIHSSDSVHQPSSHSSKLSLKKRFSKAPFYFPTIGPLVIWMIVPLSMTIFFAFTNYNLLGMNPARFSGFDNFTYLFVDPDFLAAIVNTFQLVISVVVISVGLGMVFAVLFDQPVYGGPIAKIFMIAPFFVMPTVSALIWKNILMDPVNGLIAQVMQSIGLEAIQWFEDYPMFSIIWIVSWRWIPFAFLIFLTSLQSLPPEQKEAARVDGAGIFTMFYYVIYPHLKRPMIIIIMILTIFQLSVFAEIFTTTTGGPGVSTTTLSFLIYRQALLDFDIGGASAGGIIAVIFANIVAYFLIRYIASSLKTN